MQKGREELVYRDLLRAIRIDLVPQQLQIVRRDAHGLHLPRDARVVAQLLELTDVERARAILVVLVEDPAEESYGGGITFHLHPNLDEGRAELVQRHLPGAVAVDALEEHVEVRHIEAASLHLLQDVRLGATRPEFAPADELAAILVGFLENVLHKLDDRQEGLVLGDILVRSPAVCLLVPLQRWSELVAYPIRHHDGQVFQIEVRAKAHQGPDGHKELLHRELHVPHACELVNAYLTTQREREARLAVRALPWRRNHRGP
mmetsp:Transcript_20698/g.52828  ORF Transcript_20698/g.52828 Transcript_20698/m.52828 type:complete len:261 (+) Transcript_20698:467-1249(+)